jgi:hypothetical protein
MRVAVIADGTKVIDALPPQWGADASIQAPARTYTG